MPWRPLPRIAFAICTYPFQPSSPADLPLQIGDELYIIEQGGDDGDWYRGYLVAPPSLLAGLTSTPGQTLEARVFSGIFPRVCVEVRDVLGDATGEDAGEGQSASGIDRDSNALNGDYTNGEDPNPEDWPVPPGHTATSRRSSTAGPSMIPIPVSKIPTIKSDQARETGTSTEVHHTNETATEEASQSGISDPGNVDPSQDMRPPAPVPMLKIGDETPMSRQEPLVDEIASCLREWHSTNLHELLLSQRYELLDVMSTLVVRLDNARRQLLHGILTRQELETVRENAAWDLVNGNKLLSGEVIVRNPASKGRILDSDDSPIEIAQLQSIMSLMDKPPDLQSETKPMFHLLVDVKTLFSDKGEGVVFSIQLCTKDAGQPLHMVSEAFTIDPSALDPSKQAEAEAKLRSLFTDLSSTDVGEGSNRTTTSCLVVRVYTNEPCRAFARRPPDSALYNEDGGNPRDLTGTGTWKSANFSATRRSFAWGAKMSTELTGRSRPTTARTLTGNSVRTNASRPAHVIDPATLKNAKPVKRTVAVGVIDIGEIFKGQREIEADVPIWCSPYSSEETGEYVDAQNEIVKELLQDEQNTKLKLSSSSRIRLFLKSFADFDSEALIQATPTLLYNIHQTRKIGFSGAPTKPRSDIYLTLARPILAWNAALSHPKLGSMPIPDDVSMANLQLTLEVRKMSGERIENCIYPSSNSAGHTAWRTTAVEFGESWNQTIRLAVNPEDVPGCHIVMSIADAPNFPFALCWMPLWVQDAFVRDGEHSLVLYKYDEYTSSMIAGRGAYLALPWNSKIKDEDVTGPVAAVKLSTFLCSTKYSQDPDLLGLLKWKEHDSVTIVALLKRFKFVPEIEIVKLLNEVFDTLFDCLVEYSGNDELEDLVFGALVTVLGIVRDRRFNLQPLVDHYADNKFNYPFATACLIRSFSRLLLSPEDPENSQKLRATCKVGGPVLRFIVNALQQLKEKEAGIGLRSDGASFSKDLQSIFTALDILMRNPAPVLVGTKTLLVQNFHTWVSELYVMSPEEVFSTASNFVESCSDAQGRLALYRLILINNLTSARLLTTPKTQAAWRTNTQRWLAPYWGYVGPRNQQWRDQVRLCCSVVATEIEQEFSDGSDHFVNLVRSYRALQEIPRVADESISILFPLTYPFTVKPVSVKAKFDEGLIEIAALIAAAANSPHDLKIDVLEADLPDLLFDIMKVSTSILECDAFPKSWLSVHIYQHKAIIRLLEKVMVILTTLFLPPPEHADTFKTALWNAFLATLLKLVASDALSLETFPEQKRRAAWKIAGDVREAGAQLLQKAWETIGWETSQDERDKYGIERLGGYQVQYVPSLVGLILELCLSVHDNLRQVAVNILQNMIISEWILTSDLTELQSEIIQCLDRLFRTRYLNDGMLQKVFITELTQSFEFSQSTPMNRDDPFLLAAGDLVGTIDELVDLLVAVHTTDKSGEALQLMDTLHLMDFLRDVRKEDMYIAYVHKLAQLQANAGNAPEAGLALRMHADLYEWDPTESISGLVEPHFPPQTAFERKELIFFQMIKHFEDGLAWPQALAAYEELAAQYQSNTFEFAKLARTHRAIATIHDKISNGERHTPRFFLVAYRGLGFPPTLRDKQFIFQGLHTDRLSSFVDKLQQQYPAAQIFTSGTMDEYEGQYLSVSGVSPQKDSLHPVNRKTRVPPPIREHFMYYLPRVFTITSRREPSKTGVRDQIVEKTVFTTAESFPTILRRSEVISTETVILTPVQIGLERTLRKTQELLVLEGRVAEGGEPAFAALTEGLEILVDRNSNGCVAEYWDLVPASAFNEPKEKDTETLSKKDNNEKLYGEALKAAFIDHVLSIRHCLELYVKPSQISKRAQLLKGLETNFAPVLALLDMFSQIPVPYASSAADIADPNALDTSTPRPSGVRDRHNHSRTISRGVSEKEYVSPLAYPARARRPPRQSSLRDNQSFAEHQFGGPGSAALGNDVIASSQDSTKHTTRLKVIQARMGSVGRRLSTLNVGPRRRGSKSNLRRASGQGSLTEE